MALLALVVLEGGRAAHSQRVHDLRSGRARAEDGLSARDGVIELRVTGNLDADVTSRHWTQCTRWWIHPGIPLAASAASEHASGQPFVGPTACSALATIWRTAGV